MIPKGGGRNGKPGEELAASGDNYSDFVYDHVKSIGLISSIHYFDLRAGNRGADRIANRKQIFGWRDRSRME
jgi:hypothetical protein